MIAAYTSSATVTKAIYIVGT